MALSEADLATFSYHFDRIPEDVEAILQEGERRGRPRDSTLELLREWFEIYWYPPADLHELEESILLLSW